MIITDTEANSGESALNQAGGDVSIQRMTHWEIIGGNKSSHSEIEKSGELFNSNKEYIHKHKPDKNGITFLIRQKEDMLGTQKKQSLTERFNIQDINDIRHGVLWNIKVKSGNFDRAIKKILDSQILYNPFSQKGYTYE